jgi:hypothetical protein
MGGRGERPNNPWVKSKTNRSRYCTVEETGRPIDTDGGAVNMWTNDTDGGAVNRHQ